jgi:toxin CcdB
MPQLAVYRNPRPRSAEHAPYLLEVQSDLVQTQLRVVVPLVTPDYFGPPARTLNPVLRVQGASYVLSPAEIGSLPRQQLGMPVADLRDARQEIMAALDFMLHGF